MELNYGTDHRDSNELSKGSPPPLGSGQIDAGFIIAQF